MTRIWLMLILTAVCAFSQAKGALTPTEELSAVEQIGRYALHYTRSLPNFTCTQVIHRETTPFRRPGQIARSQADVIEEELSVVNFQEIHKITKINGDPVYGVDQKQLPGMF